MSIIFTWSEALLECREYHGGQACHGFRHAADIPAIVDSKFAISARLGQSVIEHERRIADSMIKSANF